MISVIIPTHNRERLLKMCLRGLLEQTHEDFEVIVVDDGSTDGTGDMIRELSKCMPWLRYLRQENKGHSLARNLGFSKARGEIIASLDDDCVPERDWLERIEKYLGKGKAIVGVGGSVASGVGGLLASSHHILSFSSWFPGLGRSYMETFPTCNVAYRKEALMGMAFEDDRKSLGYRDVLFSKEVAKRGRLVFDPSIRVRHLKWRDGGSVREYLSSQRRQFRGFIRGGHEVHGIPGRLMLRLPFIRLALPRLFIVFGRCTKTGQASKFLRCLPLIVRGEAARWGLDRLP